MGLVSALKDGLEGQQTLKAPLAVALQVTKTFFRHGIPSNLVYSTRTIVISQAQTSACSSINCTAALCCGKIFADSCSIARMATNAIAAFRVYVFAPDSGRSIYT